MQLKLGAMTYGWITYEEGVSIIDILSIADKAGEKGPGLSGLVVVALMQTLNLFTIFFFICVISRKKYDLNNLSIIILAAGLIVLSGIKRTRLVGLYICVSGISYLAFAIYLGSQKW